MDSYWDKKHIIESILSNDNICIGERLDLVIEFLKLCKQDPVIIHERDPCPLQHYPTYPIDTPWVRPPYDPGTFYYTSDDTFNPFTKTKDTFIYSFNECNN